MSNASDHNPAQEGGVQAKSEGQIPMPTNGKDPAQDILVEEALNPEEQKGFEGMNDLEGKAPSDREDLLSTLEMPVFRMPGSNSSRTRDDEGRPLPLSGILRGRRRIGNKTESEYVQAPPIRSLLPFAVTTPPIGIEKTWLEGLPEGEAKRRQAEALAQAQLPKTTPEPESLTAPNSLDTLDNNPDSAPFKEEDTKKTAVLHAVSAEPTPEEETPEAEETPAPIAAPVSVEAPAPIEAPAPVEAPPAPTKESQTEESQERVKEPESSTTVPINALDEKAIADAEAKSMAAAAAPPAPVKPPPTPPLSKPPTPKTPPLPMAAQKATAQKPPDKKPPAPKGELNDIVNELLDEGEKKPVSRPTAPVSPPERAWYNQIFTEEYFRTLPMGFHKQTVRETQFIVDSLGVGRGGRILDLCCGFGRHTIEMAKRGYDMVGLDLSLPLLQKALNEAQRRKLSIKFIHGDVRELNFNGVFDACFSFHTSFGYFDDKTNFGILQGIHAGLKPGGRFLLEVVNRDYIIQQLPRRKWWEGSDCLFLEEVTFNYKTSVLHNKRTLIYDDTRPPWEQFIYIRLFSLHELQSMIRMAGFKVLEVSGTITGRGAFFGPHSPHLLILGEKSR